MRWRGGRRSSNIEDRRGRGAAPKVRRGTVIPESFTHGTSVQRQRWFRVGLDFGDINRCDTFNTEDL